MSGKVFSIILSILIIIPGGVALAADGYEPSDEIITQEEAREFADELKEMNTEAYDVSNRLIVSSNKDIDYMGAVNTATGIEGLYVLQYDSSASANKAYAYYDSLSYVNYVEYDAETENVLCSTETEDTFDFFPQCVSTVNSNIDDAIKLMHKENIEMSEIKVGIIDTGVAVTSFTESRLDGGYSFIDGYSEDGTEDRYDHGTQVAGTIIQNTLDNVRLYSYQIIDENGSSGGSTSRTVSAIYLAVSDGCKILNCSFRYEVLSVPKSLIEAVDTATANGVFVVCGAGNDSSSLENTNYYPALVENAVTVGALNSNKVLASFSNYGEGVDIYATGTNMTTYNASGKKVTNVSGTSVATPVISSIISLMLCVNPDLTVDEAKALLCETGQSTNEEYQNDEHRVLADAYACIKQMTGSALEQVQFDYTINGNEITFSCEEENASVYYCNNSGGTLEIPYKESAGDLFYKCDFGETVTPKYYILIVCVYAPGKAKNVEYLQLPIYDYDSGYLLTEASATQEYNIISRCQIVNEKTIEVPQYINGIEVQEIGNYCFMNNPAAETIILPESVKQIDRYAFANCPNLKTVIAPGVTDCGRYAFYDCESLVNVEIPNLTYANTAMFKNCTSLETAKLGTLTEIDNHAFYGCENLILVKTTDDDISFCARTFYNCDNLTVYTPESSTMEAFAEENDIPLLGDVQVNGGSIRVTDAGMRFGFQYNGEKNEHIAEYGFVYSYSETDDLTIDNAKIRIADNRINHGEYTTYNLVFTGVPQSAYDQTVSARAYIEIGGEYFYSDILQRNFNQIAQAVLADDEVDEATKDAVRNILNQEV